MMNYSEYRLNKVTPNTLVRRFASDAFREHKLAGDNIAATGSHIPPYLLPFWLEPYKSNSWKTGLAMSPNRYFSQL